MVYFALLEEFPRTEYHFKVDTEFIDYASEFELIYLKFVQCA